MHAPSVSWSNRALDSFLLALLVSWCLQALNGCNSHSTQPPVTAPALTNAQQPAPSDTVEAEAPRKPTPPVEPAAPPIKLRVEAGKPPYRMLAGKVMRYHRYVGRLGTQRVVVELMTNPEKYDLIQALSGGYYDARRGKTTELSCAVFYPHRRLRFAAYPADDSTEHWQAQQPLGPWLTGTVRAAGKPHRHFVLREDYHGAVPLAIRSAVMYGRPVVAEFGDRGEAGQFTGSYERQYVQLVGSAAHRPALQRTLPSRPAQVRARLQQEFRAGEADMANIREWMNVALNNYGILSYSKYISDFGAGASHPQNIYKSWSYDLHNGRRITLASLIKPGSKPALLRLALRYMDPSYLKDLQDWYDNPQEGAESLAYLDLEEVFGLAPDGLTLAAKLGPHSMGPTTIIIPYAALRPLLRPRTPLNRVLVAQGLPPVR